MGAVTSELVISGNGRYLVGAHKDVSGYDRYVVVAQ